MRADSPFVLAFCGTFAIHVILLVTGDAINVYYPRSVAEPAPRIEMIDVEIPAPPPPPKVVEPEQAQTNNPFGGPFGGRGPGGRGGGRR